MNDLTRFWQERFAAHGNTGKADTKIYAFDQECGLQWLREWLDKTQLPPGKALDFGCGSGDFSKLLVKLGWNVVAYEPLRFARLFTLQAEVN
jgi:2-polyprenyl-3-methyl-5-hydroxy-6-metoxy-1,4-benzoquinol methylase